MRAAATGGWARRAAAIAALATGCALALTGCFVIPLADGRSPFDDPQNPSFRDVAVQRQPVRDAIEGILPSEDWDVEVTTLTDNCEGPCNLSLGIEITPSASVAAATRESGTPDARGRIPVSLPADRLTAVVKAVVPIVAGARLRFSVEGMCVHGEAVHDDSVCTDLTAAGQQILGTTEVSAGDSDFWFSDDTFMVRTATRPADEILARLS